MSDAPSPFGSTITDADIIESIEFFDTWEDRYKYIIDLGRALPPLSAADRTDDHIVRGCQSQVWLTSELRDGEMWFFADSDAFIVKGLLAVVLAAVNGKSPGAVQGVDMDAYFEKLGLLRHLSVTRGNGLRAMVERVRRDAAAQ